MSWANRRMQEYLFRRLLYVLCLALVLTIATVSAQEASAGYAEIESALMQGIREGGAVIGLTDSSPSPTLSQQIGNDELQYGSIMSISTVPEAALQLIRDAPYDRDVYSVFGLSEWDHPILKVRELVFGPMGTLQLNSLSQDFLIVFVDRLAFTEPRVVSTITRGPLSAEAGFSYPQSDTPAGPPRPTSSGTDGDKGIDGRTGGRGDTVHLPTVLLIVNDVATQGGGPPAERAVLHILFPGIEGGEGGRGQNGGPGAPGTRGRDAVQGWDCKQSGQDGGDGGDGGRGGRGGSGGDGGRGADIYILGSSDVLSYLAFARILNEGGEGGAGGPPGRSGRGGPGADGGRGSLSCGGGRGGSQGRTLEPLGFGPEGLPGAKGNVVRVVVPD